MGRTDEELHAKRDGLMSRDASQVSLIKTFGVDLDKKRQLDLTFWAPSETAANLLGEALKRNGMPPNLTLGPAGSSDANPRWLIRCALQASVTFITAKENLVTFLLFADKYDCEYDGWGTAIVEAATPVKPAS